METSWRPYVANESIAQVGQQSQEPPDPYLFSTQVSFKQRQSMPNRLRGVQQSQGVKRHGPDAGLWTGQRNLLARVPVN